MTTDEATVYLLGLLDGSSSVNHEAIGLIIAKLRAGQEMRIYREGTKRHDKAWDSSTRVTEADVDRFMEENESLMSKLDDAMGGGDAD